MLPRSPSPLRYWQILGVLALLAAVAGMVSCAGIASSSTSSPSSPTSQASADAIPSIYMGMQMNSGTISRQPWPSVPFGAQRLWDSGVSWQDINPADGVYNWTLLDEWLSAAQAHNVDILYTFGETPAWASSSPNDSTCAAGAGSCDPPNDLNTDGTGSNQHWKDFVSALVAHSQQSSTGHIQYWEIWNEALGNPLRCNWKSGQPQPSSPRHFYRRCQVPARFREQADYLDQASTKCPILDCSTGTSRNG